MPLKQLVALVGRNTVRNRGELALSAFGIVIGIAAFVFFLGLSGGVRNVVLGEIFPLERLVVVAPKTHVAGRTFAKKLDDAVVEQIRARPGVVEVVPRMRMQFPATGGGTFEGKEIRFEVGGFADGIAPSFAADEPFAKLFQDWESPDRLAELKPCEQTMRWGCVAPLDICGADRMCRPSRRALAPDEVPPSCVPVPQYSCADSGHYYCDMRDRMCHHRVPVIVSRTLLELYNASFAESHGLPAIGGLEQFIAERSLDRMRFEIGLGDTYVAGSNTALAARPRAMEGYLVGLSDKAMGIGMTLPIQYIERWNREYLGEEAATAYSSIIVEMASQDEVAGFSAWLRDEAELTLEDSQGERFAVAIFVVTTLFVLISFIIVGISAINIAHTFFMQVSERRRELGLLRALGATRADVRLIILAEAGVIGVIGGVLGIALAVGAARAVDAASARWLPAFPFKPDTYFDFGASIVVGGLAFAVLFCVLGGFLPARKASRMEPARALAAQ